MKNIALAVLQSFLFTAFATAAAPPLPVNVQRALGAVSANELKGDLSFLASDALEGRFTPSPGLDVAAEFIASKFRAAGLEPGGDRDYFQMAEMIERRQPAMSSDVTVNVGERKFVIPAREAALDASAKSAHLVDIPLLLFPSGDAAELKGVDLTNKAVFAPQPDFAKLPNNERMAAYRKMMAFAKASAAAGAALIVQTGNARRGMSAPRLLFADQAANGTPTLSLANEELAKLLATPVADAKISAEIPAALDTKVRVKNVIGILRGSDPVLSKTAVLLTAHYDHVGTSETAKGMAMGGNSATDHIYNGANDDGSGTVSVIEIARALAQLQPRPKRSIVFMTFFGEERGELGSQFYGKHPVFPIAKTVADLNLEQMGRTDATNGRQLNNASVTGFDYSDVTGFLVRAGQRVGIKVYKDAEASDAYFTRSDNDALAEQGVPAHTLCVAFDYPDYHGLGDEWPKVDYENMAKVDRMVLLALLNIANSPKSPEWNAKNAKTEPFRAARAASH